MSRKCFLIFLIHFLLIHKLAYPIDLIAMGCSPSEKPKHKVSGKSEQASPSKKSLNKLNKNLLHKKTPSGKGVSAQLKQIGAFKNKKNAEKYVKELKEKGCVAVIRSGFLNNNKEKIYRVFVGKTDICSLEKLFLRDEQGIKEVVQPVAEQKEEQKFDELNKGLLSDRIKMDIMLKKKPKEESVTYEISSIEPAEDSEILPEKLSDKKAVKEELEEKNKYEITVKDLEDMVSSAKKELVSTSSPEGVQPIGKRRITHDVFGRRGGYIHPFLSIAAYYTDNVFNRNDQKSEDLVTVISPGIWITVPHIYEKLLTIETSNISPGGFILSRHKTESFRRYQTYLFYNADIEKFSKYSSEDTSNHKLEGLFLYNFRGGLSIEFVEQFLASHDARGTGISQELDKFRTNLVNLIITYDVAERFKFRVDYSNFLVRYEASRNDFRDRIDNGISTYIFYRFKPKTTLFFEYEYFDIDYNKKIMPNSREHHYFSGFQWDITAKSKGNIKVGYGIKDFGETSKKSKDALVEAQIDHKFTPKTSIKIKLSRKTNETNISTTDFILSNILEIEYIQRFKRKITGNVDFMYMSDTYKGDLNFGGEVKERKDNLMRSAFSLQYEFRDWIKLDLGYIYSQRNSNFDFFDYESNTVFVRVIGSL